ncbi:MAG TPA: hypothetical protein P5246_03285 [Candidatus Omnitrophota bacterium]|nr:hypothetical protein [Candidatus Omnitrophota bacterium]
MFVLVLTAALTLAAITGIQLMWWIPKNGFMFFGTCVNHFGEPYSCTVLDWIARAFLSPFAWPAVIFIALICFAISMIIKGMLKR